MIRAFASDLDGTFLGPDGRASALNVEATLAAAEAGCHVIFATGRPWRWLDVLDPVLAARPHVLCSNGALRYDLGAGRVLGWDAIPDAAGAQVVDQLRHELPQAWLAVETAEGMHSDRGYPHRWPTEPLQGSVEDVIAAGQGLKLLVRHEQLSCDRLAAVVQPITQGLVEVTWSQSAAKGLVEISPLGITKGTGLATLLGELDIDPAHVAGFGDMPNDAAMLDLVGRPYRMDPAHPMLVEAGYPVAGSGADGGVGRTVRKLLGLPDATPPGTAPGR